MKVAALYDVHAMPWALEAVLAEVDVDAIVLGGDYLYGPYPQELVAVVRSLDATVLRGNCEDMAEEWERSQLAGGDLEWLQALPLTATVDGVLYCHAAPTSNLPITTAITPEEAVRQTFDQPDNARCVLEQSFLQVVVSLCHCFSLRWVSLNVER